MDFKVSFNKKIEDDDYHQAIIFSENRTYLLELLVILASHEDSLRGTELLVPC